MNNQSKKTIAIAATFTAEPIEDSLNFWSRELDIPLLIKFAPFNQVFQQLLDSSSLMRKNKSGMNVILIRFEDWVRMEDSRTGNLLKTSEQEKVEENVKGFLTALSTISEGSATPYLVCICPASQAILNDSDQNAIFEQLEKLIDSEVNGLNNVYLVNSSELLRTYPVSTYYDPHGDQLGRIPYTPAFYTALGTMISRKFYTLHPRRYYFEFITERNKDAFTRYNPKTYEGRVVIFRSSIQPREIIPDPTLGWGELIEGDLELFEIPAYHQTILSEPQVNILAEKLKYSWKKPTHDL